MALRYLIEIHTLEFWIYDYNVLVFETIFNIIRQAIRKST